jgi:hypothetical protein
MNTMYIYLDKSKRNRNSLEISQLSYSIKPQLSLFDEMKNLLFVVKELNSIVILN